MFARAWKSEWVKFRTLKSNVWLAVSAAAAFLMFGVMAATAVAGNIEPPPGAPVFTAQHPVDAVMSGANFAVLLICVLGVLLGAREYPTGMARVTFTATPSRWPVLVARLAVYLMVTVPLLTVAAAAVFTVGTGIIADAGMPSADWGDPGVPRVVFGTAANLVGIGAMGIGIGFLTRSIATGIATLIGGLLILPSLLGALLPEQVQSAFKFFPSNAGQAFTSAAPLDGLLTPTAGIAVYALWIVVTLVAAAVVLQRRDV